MSVRPASAPDVQRRVLLSIQVEHCAASEQLGVELHRARQAGFLVDREQQLKRPVNRLGVFGHRHRGRNADAIVRAQRRAGRVDVVAEEFGREVVGRI